MSTVKSLGLFKGIQYDLVYGANNTSYSWDLSKSEAEGREHNYGNCEMAKGKLVEVLNADINSFLTNQINSAVTTDLSNDDNIFIGGINLAVGTGCWIWDCSKGLIQSGATLGPYTNWKAANPDNTHASVSYEIQATAGATQWESVVGPTSTVNGRGYIVCYPRGLVKGEVLFGTCDPSDDSGKFGDVYINKSTCVIFGPKTCTWGCGTKLVYNVPVGCLSKVCTNDFEDANAPLCGSGNDCGCPCDNPIGDDNGQVDCSFGKNCGSKKPSGDCKKPSGGCTKPPSDCKPSKCCGSSGSGTKTYSMFSFSMGGKK